MDELLEVCNTLLDNANLDLSIEVTTGTIVLDFVAGGSLENIVIRCGEYTRLRVAKGRTDDQCFFIGQTEVETISSRKKLVELDLEDGWQGNEETMTVSPTFRVKCDGGIMLDILCGSLSWKIDDGEFKSLGLPETTT